MSTSRPSARRPKRPTSSASSSSHAASIRSNRCSRANGGRPLQVHAGIEQHGGVFAIGHAERFGAGEAGPRGLARRRFSGPRLRPFSAEKPPATAAVGRRAPNITHAENRKNRPAPPPRPERAPPPPPFLP